MAADGELWPRDSSASILHPTPPTLPGPAPFPLWAAISPSTPPPRGLGTEALLCSFLMGPPTSLHVSVRLGACT